MMTPLDTELVYATLALEALKLSPDFFRSHTESVLTCLDRTDAQYTLDNGEYPAPVEALTDAQWTEIFEACDFEADGIPLSAFLENPWPILFDYGQEGAVVSMMRGYRPLLRQQAQIARQLRPAAVPIKQGA